MSGVHSARPNHGREIEPSGEGAVERFYHSLQSWTELWDGGLFQKDTVKVKARLVELGGGDSEDQWIMGGPSPDCEGQMVHRLMNLNLTPLIISRCQPSAVGSALLRSDHSTCL